MKRRYIIAAVGGIIIGAAAVGPIMSDVEQAKYEVVKADGAIELRDYAPMIVAQVSVEGERKEAINKGFRLIADYIFGNNSASQKVAMTAPVIQQPSEKIAMTAPVIQQPDGNAWKVQFVMPASYTLKTLPKPNNKQVKLLEVEGKRFAAIRFSGRSTAESLEQRTDELNAYIKAEKLKTLSAPTYAFFNPPWTLPPFRRNEVMVEIAP